MAFYRLTEEHWYFNGNGRIATCFINSVLNAFGKPSILLRMQQDKNNPNSQYNKVFKNLDDNPEQLKAYIHNRMQCSVPSLPIQIQLVEARVAMAKQAARIKTQFPHFSFDGYYENIINKFTKEVRLPHSLSQDEANLCAYKYILDYSEKQFQQVKKSAVVVPSAIQKQISEEEKIRTVQKLTDITGYNDWKIHVQKGSLLALRYFTHDTRQTMHQLTEKLNATKVLTATNRQTPNEKIPVLQLTNINLELLSTISTCIIANDEDVSTNKLLSFEM